jgi:hypothetical protein
MILTRSDYILLAISLLALAACGPKPADMSVVFAAEGSLIHLSPGTWDAGEVKDCAIATHKDPYLGNDKRVLLCGPGLKIAWSWGERIGVDKGLGAVSHNEELLDSLTPKTFPVTLHGNDAPLAILSDGEPLPKRWKCQRTADGIDCR